MSTTQTNKINTLVDTFNLLSQEMRKLEERVNKLKKGKSSDSLQEDLNKLEEHIQTYSRAVKSIKVGVNQVNDGNKADMIAYYRALQRNYSELMESFLNKKISLLPLKKDDQPKREMLGQLSKILIQFKLMSMDMKSLKTVEMIPILRQYPELATEAASIKKALESMPKSKDNEVILRMMKAIATPLFKIVSKFEYIIQQRKINLTSDDSPRTVSEMQQNILAKQVDQEEFENDEDNDNGNDNGFEGPRGPRPPGGPPPPRGPPPNNNEDNNDGNGGKKKKRPNAAQLQMQKQARAEERAANKARTQQRQQEAAAGAEPANKTLTGQAPERGEEALPDERGSIAGEAQAARAGEAAAASATADNSNILRLSLAPMSAGAGAGGAGAGAGAGGRAPPGTQRTFQQQRLIELGNLLTKLKDGTITDEEMDTLIALLLEMGFVDQANALDPDRAQRIRKSMNERRSGSIRGIRLRGGSKKEKSSRFSKGDLRKIYGGDPISPQQKKVADDILQKIRHFEAFKGTSARAGAGDGAAPYGARAIEKHLDGLSPDEGAGLLEKLRNCMRGRPELVNPKDHMDPHRRKIPQVNEKGKRITPEFGSKLIQRYVIGGIVAYKKFNGLKEMFMSVMMFRNFMIYQRSKLFKMLQNRYSGNHYVDFLSHHLDENDKKVTRNTMIQIILRNLPHYAELGAYTVLADKDVRSTKEKINNGIENFIEKMDKARRYIRKERSTFMGGSNGNNQSDIDMIAYEKKYIKEAEKQQSELTEKIERMKSEQAELEQEKRQRKSMEKLASIEEMIERIRSKLPDLVPVEELPDLDKERRDIITFIREKDKKMKISLPETRNGANIDRIMGKVDGLTDKDKAKLGTMIQSLLSQLPTQEVFDEYQKKTKRFSSAAKEVHALMRDIKSALGLLNSNAGGAGNGNANKNVENVNEITHESVEAFIASVSQNVQKIRNFGTGAGAGAGAANNNYSTLNRLEKNIAEKKRSIGPLEKKRELVTHNVNSVKKFGVTVEESDHIIKKIFGITDARTITIAFNTENPKYNSPESILIRVILQNLRMFLRSNKKQDKLTFDVLTEREKNRGISGYPMKNSEVLAHLKSLESKRGDDIDKMIKKMEHQMKARGEEYEYQYIDLMGNANENNRPNIFDEYHLLFDYLNDHPDMMSGIRSNNQEFQEEIAELRKDRDQIDSESDMLEYIETQRDRISFVLNCMKAVMNTPLLPNMYNDITVLKKLEKHVKENMLGESLRVLERLHRLYMDDIDHLRNTTTGITGTEHLEIKNRHMFKDVIETFIEELTKIIDDNTFKNVQNETIEELKKHYCMTIVESKNHSKDDTKNILVIMAELEKRCEGYAKYENKNGVNNRMNSFRRAMAKKDAEKAAAAARTASQNASSKRFRENLKRNTDHMRVINQLKRKFNSKRPEANDVTIMLMTGNMRRQKEKQGKAAEAVREREKEEREVREFKNKLGPQGREMTNREAKYQMAAQKARNAAARNASRAARNAIQASEAKAREQAPILQRRARANKLRAELSKRKADRLAAAAAPKSSS